MRLGAKKLAEVFRKLQTGCSDEQQVWVGVALSRPGNHSYIVRYESSGGAEEAGNNEGHVSDSESQEDAEAVDGIRFSFHTGMAPARTEAAAKGTTRDSKYSKRRRVFVKEDSVFDDWTADSEFLLTSCFKHDCSQMKLQDFIKSVKDLQQCEASLQSNYSILKKMFICLASGSCFPCVDWKEFSEFCVRCELVDEGLTLQQIREYFIMTHSDYSA